MTGLREDVRGAVRVFRLAPGFAAVVVVTVAVGVGAATAVWSVVSGVLLSPMAFEDSEQVVKLWGRSAQYPRAPLTVGDHNDLANGVAAFSGVAGSWSNNALILGEADAEQVSVGWVTPEYFDVLGIRPALGRSLDPLDDAAVLLAHDLWARRYGADPSVVGSTIDLSGTSFEVAGVLPADRDPNLSAFSGARTGHQVWRLMPPDWLQGDDRSVGWLSSTARLADGVTLEEAQAEVDALMTTINQTITERDGGTDMTIGLVSVRSDLVGGVARTLWVVLGAVCGVLLIAATNVAHLMLGRGELRRSEVAIRAALGGSRMRLVRQLLVEGGVLAAIGGLGGLLVAWWGVAGLIAVAPPTLPRLDQIDLDAGVLFFAVLATAATALVFAVVPAIRVTGIDGTRGLGRDRGASGDRHQQGLSRVLVVVQVALSLTLVVGTGLLLKSADGLRAVDLGFDPEGVVTFALEVPDWGDGSAAAAARMTDYIDRIEAIPGVLFAGFTNRVPLAGGLFTGTYRSEEAVAAEAPTSEASVRYVTQGYLDAMGARLSAGRGLRLEDGIGVALIDETLAESAWPGEDAVGRRLQVGFIGGDPIWVEIVGVIAPMKHAGVAEAASATVFAAMLPRADQQNFRYMAVRVDGEPVAYLEPLRAVVRSVDADAVIARVQTMRELFAEDVAATTFATLLLSLFGATALLLATVGLHGVMAVAVRSRRRELGVRMALGAQPGALLRAVVASGVALVVLGAAAGTLLSLGLGRILGSLLFEVRPSDVATLASATLVTLAIGTLAAYLPARLVLHVDPVVTLREK